MNQKRRFRFEWDIEFTLKVEKVCEKDYGPKRYIKELVNEFAGDPEALRGLIYLYFFDNYCEYLPGDVNSFLEKPGSEKNVILRAAQKCVPEVFQYFSDLFANDPVKEPGPDNEEQEQETWKGEESDWVFDRLIRKLCTMETVNAVFSELPLENVEPSAEMNRNTMYRGEKK